MLVGLRLQNIALIESLELTFGTGLTVLTGETGAGKSLLLDALSSLFGGETSAPGFRLMRKGSNKSQIEASFLITAPVESWLTQESLDAEEGELLVTREWRLKDQRVSSRIRINGVIVNRHLAANLKSLLIDLTAQGQIQNISSSGKQLLYLDSFSGVKGEEALRQVYESWHIWLANKKALQIAEKKLKESKLNSNYLQELLDDIEAANLHDPNEDKILQGEQDRLVHGVRLQEGLSLLLSSLQSGKEGFPSILDQFVPIIHELQIISQVDSSLQKSLTLSLELQAGLQELVFGLEDYVSSLKSDPQRLNELQDRLSLLKRLQLRHGIDLAELLKKREELKESLNHEENAFNLEELRQKEHQSRLERDHNNELLSSLRSKSAKKLEDQLLQSLRPLGLENVRFKVEILRSEATNNGTDSVRFLFSANPGQPLAPLAEVASGGEMSRFLLALKTVLSAQGHFATLLFDEIDAGVSGRVSTAIAESLKELSVNQQVFCVTHQPLVAAAADHHFSVTKSVDSGITRSHVTSLTDFESRRNELAQLAGGDFKEASLYAASLLDKRAA